MAQVKTSVGAGLILARIEELEKSDRVKAIKTKARKIKVRPEFVGHTLAIFNGHGYTNVKIADDMVGRTLAKIAPNDQPTARTKYLSISAKKMRQVADLVKGKPVEKALDILNFTPKYAAYHMAKTLKAAVANKLSIEGTSHLNPEDLHIRRINVDPGPTAGRLRYRAMGRVFRVRKRYCHLNIYLEERPGVQVPAKATTKKAKASADSSKGAAKTATKAKTAKKKVDGKTKVTREKVSAKPAKKTGKSKASGKKI